MPIKCNMKLLILLLLLSHLLNITRGERVEMDDEEQYSSRQALKPVGRIEYREMGNNIARRRLAPFQLCLLCKCCTASSSSCTTVPCCFGIDCQLPNKPFGVCAFVPKTCNCTACAAL